MNGVFSIITHKPGKPLRVVDERKFWVSATQQLREFELATEIQFDQILSFCHFVNTWTGQKNQIAYKVMCQKQLALSYLHTTAAAYEVGAVYIFGN
jgi:hypothetical protein